MDTVTEKTKTEKVKKNKTKKDKAGKKRAAAPAVAAIAAAGLTLGTLFSSPAELLNKEFLLTPPYELSDCIIADDDDDADISSENEQEEKQKGIRAALRRLFQRLPFGVKAFAGVPVWIIGRVLLAVLAPLIQNVLPSALMAVLKYLCIAALIFAAVVLPVKAVMPEVPLKKLVTNRKIAFSAAISILFGAVGGILQIFYPEAMKTYEIVESGMITLIVVLIGFGILKIRADRKKGMTA